MKRQDLTVRDLMTTALVTIKADETIKEAHAEMELGVIRHLLVTDDRGRLVGLLSDRDILGALHGRKPRRVSEVMARDVITTRIDTRASTAAQIMLDRKIGSLPVLDDEGALVGIVTQTDFLDVAHRALLDLPLGR
jgi:CBS domain-containing protein